MEIVLIVAIVVLVVCAAFISYTIIERIIFPFVLLVLVITGIQFIVEYLYGMFSNKAEEKVSEE